MMSHRDEEKKRDAQIRFRVGIAAACVLLLLGGWEAYSHLRYLGDFAASEMCYGRMKAISHALMKYEEKHDGLMPIKAVAAQSPEHWYALLGPFLEGGGAFSATCTRYESVGFFPVVGPQSPWGKPRNSLRSSRNGEPIPLLIELKDVSGAGPSSPARYLDWSLHPEITTAGFEIPHPHSDGCHVLMSDGAIIAVPADQLVAWLASQMAPRLQP